MKYRKILMTTLLVVTAVGAFSMKGHTNRGPYIYGKIATQCQILCSTTPNYICAMNSSDNKYYGLENCTTPYSGMRYAMPGN
ncbi:hypothetical protein C7475_109156 [Chitinophaga sp. S165]|nr:hypothetical protein C7475_109156 [Chitinophaga sp. S165]